MLTSEFAIRFMVSAVSAKALLKFWIAVSVSAFICSPPSRSWGQGNTREQFAALLAAATLFDVPSILTMPQALDALEEERVIGAWDAVEAITPWPALNRRLGRWRGGNLVVVSGPPGTGKTTWGLNVAAWWAACGSPALFYCLEMSVIELVQHVLCAHYQLEEEQITGEVIAKARLELAEWPLYLGSDPRLTGQRDVMSLLEQAVRRYGLKLLFFDNLHLLARSIQHRTEEVGVLTKGFKLFAMQHEIPVGLIPQPRKLEPGKVMTPWDLKESVDIFADADQVVLLHREMQAATKEREAVAAAADEARDDETSDNLRIPPQDGERVHLVRERVKCGKASCHCADSSPTNRSHCSRRSPTRP